MRAFLVGRGAAIAVIVAMNAGAAFAGDPSGPSGGTPVHAGAKALPRAQTAPVQVPAPGSIALVGAAACVLLFRRGKR